MFENFNIVYLLILVAISVISLLLFKSAQKTVLEELYKTLYKENKPEKFLKMLGVKRLKLIFRSATIALLCMEGALCLDDSAMIEQQFAVLDAIKLNSAEKLNYYQKRLAYYITNNKKRKAKDSLTLLTALLEKEKDPKLIAVLEDARLLTGVYIDQDITLIKKLSALAEAQSGTVQGITCYRLAKLYYYAGDNESAKNMLKRADSSLEGTFWQEIVRKAQDDCKVLEAN